MAQQVHKIGANLHPVGVRMPGPHAGVGRAQNPLGVGPLPDAALQSLVRGQVNANFGKSDQHARMVAQRGQNDPRPKKAAVLAPAPGFFFVKAGFPRFAQIVFGPVPRFLFLRVEHGQRMANRLLGGVTLHVLGGPVPDGNDPLRVREKNRHILDFFAHQPMKLGHLMVRQ